MKKKFWLVIFIFLIVVFAIHKDYGISWDEPFYLDYGKKYTSSFFDSKKIQQKLDLRHALTHGAFFDILYYLPLKLANQQNNFDALHFEKAFFSSLVLIFVFLALRAISKNSLVPFLGVLLMIATPRWFGDIFDNHMDGASTILYSILTFISIKLFLFKWENKNGRNKFLPYFIVFSIVSTIAFSHRVILFFLPFLTWLFLFFRFYRSKNLLHFFKLTLFFLAVFFCTLFIIDPALRTYGLQGFIQKIYYSARYVYGRANLFEGRFIDASHLPWYYLAKWMMITTPGVTLGLFFLGSLGSLGGLGGFGRLGRFGKMGEIFILVSFFVPFVLVMIVRPVLYDGWRQFLFLSVPMSMIAALGFESFLKIGSLLGKKWVLLVSLVLLMGLFNTLITMSKLHPYEYVYFNGLVGGLRGAYGQYETDYWGKSYREAVEWLKSDEIKDKNKIYKIFSCDNTFSSSYFFAKNMKLTKNLSEADYAVCFTRWDEDKKIEGKVIHIVERDGVSLNFVKKLR